MGDAMSKLQRRMTRRDLLKLGAGVAGLAVLAGCAPAATPAAPTTAPAAPAAAGGAPAAAAGTPAVVAKTGDAFDWKRFKGESIDVIFPKGSIYDVLQAVEKEFTDLTGIQVSSEQIPEQQQRQKQVIEFTSGATSFDVTATSLHVQKSLFGKTKWLVDMRDMLKDPTLTSPDYDWADMSQAGINLVTQADGRVDTLPCKIDYWIIYWNKELFAAKGVKYPTSFDELVAAAKALHDPSKNVAGFAARGLKNANTPVWTSFMIDWGVDTVDAKGNMYTDGPEAIAAAELYKTLMKDYAPKGVAGFNWNECQTTFMQGQAAMWFDGIGFSTPLEDPKTSKIVGKVGYSPLPKGPKEQFSGMFGDGVGISSLSKKKGPAYLYCQWFTNKQNQIRTLVSGAGAPPRNSAYKDQAALKQLTVPQEWVDCLIQVGKMGHLSLPVIEPVTEFRDVFGVALTNMIGGADAATELKKATADFKPVLEKSLKS